ncbi:GntR family transcriptional regulator [Robertmurraya massiliosenegalensis]|uniref:GntR family transcriptional regulator n=1 Tax=Robertmurraya TaxID=2837507 RepID=UPI0039A6DB44
MSLIQKRRLSKDVAYSQVKQKIIYGELKPDQVVREEELANMLEISRTPLRQAVQMLEMEEFLVRKPNGRLKVASITKEEVEEIFMIRSMLEGSIAKNAANNATKHDIETLTEILEKLRQSFHLGYGQEFVSYGNEFHDYLAKISGLKTSVRVLNMIKDHANRYCHFVSMYGKWNDQADEEHNLILQSIKNKDGVSAEKAMQNHILSSLHDVIKRIEDKDR